MTLHDRVQPLLGRGSSLSSMAVSVCYSRIVINGIMLMVGFFLRAEQQAAGSSSFYESLRYQMGIEGKMHQMLPHWSRHLVLQNPKIFRGVSLHPRTRNTFLRCLERAASRTH